MKTFDNYDDAYTFMKTKNRAIKKAGNHSGFAVLVNGPDEYFTVMELKDAVDNEFLYEWAV